MALPSPADMEVKRYFLEVMYNGTAFHGSQVQGDTVTVQGSLNKAISVLMRTEIETFGASRTDEGVHALSNFYHFDTDVVLHPHFRYKINAILPDGVALKAVYQARDLSVNARFDALSRSYRYRIYHSKDPFKKERALFFPYKPDVEILHQTAAILTEYTNFETFSKRNTQSHTFICSIKCSFWEVHEDELHYVVEANRFLRGMVRALVGTQLQVARGRHTLQQFREIIEAQDCTGADFSVTGHGLYLEKVKYPDGALTLLDLG